MGYKLLVSVAALMLSQPAIADNKLISAGESARIGGSEFSVTPNRDWNRLGARPGRSAQTWTLDGEALNDLTFYAGIEDGRTLLRERDRRNQPVPRFSSSMLLTDIPMLFENSYRAALAIGMFETGLIEPVQFAGVQGVKFEYTFVAADDVRRKGEAYGAIINGKLYLMSFEAPEIHFFENGVSDFRRLVATASVRDED